MSTMKKLFALVLALAMMMSVAVFANAYDDSASIDKNCKSAVELLSAIGLIKGDNHGNFNPENTITRAEAAAIIYRLRNAGSDDASLWVGSEPFTDVADGEWYAGYIAWCYNYGIIDGVSATEFKPKQPIKGTELAKMLLATAGYKSDIEGYVGANWEKNVIEDASAAGLFDNYGLGFVKPCARQWAALMIVNALETEEAAYLGDYRLPTGGEKIGAKYLDLAPEKTMIVVADDVFTVVPKGKLTAVTGTTAGANGIVYNRQQYDTDRTDVAKKGEVLLVAKADLAAYVAGTVQALAVKYDGEESIVGQEVKVAAKKDGTVYGFAVTGNSVSGKLTMTKGTSNSKTVYTVKVGSKVYVNAKEAGTLVSTDAAFATLKMNFRNTNIYSDHNKTRTAVLWSQAGVSAPIMFDLGLLLNKTGEYNLAAVETLYNDYVGTERTMHDYYAYDFEGDGKIDRVVISEGYVGYVDSSNTASDSKLGVYVRHYNTNGVCNHGLCGGTTYETGYTTSGSCVANAVVMVTGNFQTQKVEVKALTPVISKLVEVDYDENYFKFEDGTETGYAYCNTTNPYVWAPSLDVATRPVSSSNPDRRDNESMTKAEWEALLGKNVRFWTDGNYIVRVDEDAYVPSTGSTTPATPDYLDNSKLAYLIEVKDVVVATETVDPVWGTVTEGSVTVTKVKVMYADGTTEIRTYDLDTKLAGAITDKTGLVTGKVYQFAETADAEIVLFTNLAKANKVYYGAETSAKAVAAGTLSNAVTYSLEKNRFGNVLVNDNTVIFVKYTTKVDNVDTVVYTTMKISEFKKNINGATFNLIARDNAAISTALVASVDFGANDLPKDPDAPEAPAGTYLVYVTGTAVKYNLGADKDGNPINVAKFTAVDILTGVAGDYYLADINGTVTKGAIITGEFNKDGIIEAAYTTVAIGTFADSFAAPGYFKGAVKAKSGELVLIGNTLLDKSFLAKNCVVVSKSGSTFAVSSYEAISKAVVTSSSNSTLQNNIVIRINAEGKIDLIMFTANGSAF